MHMRHIVICGLSGCAFFRMTERFPIKKRVKCVFDFRHNFCLNISQSEKNSAEYDKKCTFVHVKYPLYPSKRNATSNFLTDFRKIHKYQIPRKSVQWGPSRSIRTERQTDRQTDVTKIFAILRMCLRKDVDNSDFLGAKLFRNTETLTL